MKLSISLTDDDVAALDRLASAAGLRSRSAAVQHAIRSLADPGLDDAYEQAWAEWETSGEAAAWSTTVADGLDQAPDAAR